MNLRHAIPHCPLVEPTRKPAIGPSAPPIASKDQVQASVFRWMLAGILFFLIHASLIAHHTYFSASKRNTVMPPPRAKVFGPAPWEQWSNVFDLNRWDAILYEEIAKNGYPPPNANGSESFLLVWFPGYPLLVRLLSNAMRQPIPPILSLVSAIGTLAFWLLLWSSPIMRRTLGLKSLTIVSILILIWPGAFFWFAGMTEPLIALLTLAVIVAWISDRSTAALVLCGLGTSIKQVFAPIGLILVSIRWLRKRPGPIRTLSWLALSWSGLLAYSIYCWIVHGDFIAYAHAARPIYGRVITLRAFIDIPNFFQYAQTMNGGSAIANYGLVIVTAAIWLVHQRGKGTWREMAGGEIPLSFFLWTVGGACMALYISFDAYGFSPYRFTNFLRYQTTNVAHFLLAAYLLRQARTRILCLGLLPLAAVGLYWQNELTVRYWNWWWVS